MSSPDIVSILENSKEFDRVRKEQEDILSEINKLHKKLQANLRLVWDLRWLSRIQASVSWPGFASEVEGEL
ncbi:hypothetical protein JHK85_045199 [Glycine max]|uniref:SAGA-associated factor 29-like B n=1 Tax=Glycine soja TaxID=3848 RepID=A0A445GFI0_GLYSO|nr:hypothetical protein JHK85_045199 [Glycine max]RZB59933.1 SAGA-associated factor 29-like B [Glycine soja]